MEKAPVLSDFRNIVRVRILKDMLQSVKSKGWKILVLDRKTSKILSAACRMFDLMEEGVSVVEDIEKSRQPFPQLEAVYFLSPTHDNITNLKNDFNDPNKPKYAAAHIFFSSHLSDIFFSDLAHSEIVPKIKSLKEANVEFLANEAHVFHFDMPTVFQTIFSGPDDQTLDRELRKMATSLATVCLALGEFPIVRASNTLTARFASLFLSELQKYKNVPDYPAKNDRGPATLIILDRTVDAKAPFLHEFTYQAMLADLLYDKITNGKYTLTYEDNNGQKKTKDVLIDENDSLWTTIRHMHISTTLDYLQKRIAEFQKNNKAAALIQRQGSGNDEVSIKQLGEAIRAMPTFQETLGKYSLHQTLTKEAYERFNERNLKNFGLLEQDLSTGQDAEGEAPANILGRMTSILNDKVKDQYAKDQKSDRLRLLALYSISQGLDSSVKAMIPQVGLDSSTVQRVLTNASELHKGVTGVRDYRQKGKEVTSFVISRYVPMIKHVVEELIEDNLTVDDFPYVGDAPEGGGKSKEIRSLKKNQPAWAKGKDKQDNSLSGPRIIVFVIGGVTFSELRAAAELTESCQREVIIGSERIISPHDFMADLKNFDVSIN